MKFIALLGAGFSRNWGGWLANEAFEYLLGCKEITPPLRSLLLDHKRKGGFEGALSTLQADSRRLASSPRLLTDFQDAIRHMFFDMNMEFAHTNFEFCNDLEYSVSKFLGRFDAIFSLNQDQLLERHYLNDNVSLMSDGRWDGWSIPGMRPQLAQYTAPEDRNLGLWAPTDPSEFTVPDRFQPYFKLHGSSNWASPTDKNLMVMGGDKQVSIDQHPILKFYYEQFCKYVCEGRTRLMVIGYSFSDDHINRALLDGAGNSELTVFVVDPLGIDVMDKNRDATVYRPDILAETLWPRTIGASRRPLSSTFRNDRVEHGKLMQFFVE